MVERYWGAGSARPEDYAALVRPEEGGIRTDELAAALRARGWRALRVEPELEAIGSQVREGRPVVLLIRVGPDRFHYVVVVAVTGESVLLHDPARAPYRRMGRAELERRWEAADRWGLVILPGGRDGGRGAGRGGREGPATADEAPHTAGEAGPAVADTLPEACSVPLREGIEAARTGSLARADSLLVLAVDRCPAAAAPRRELAGLRFRQQRWGAAAASARETLERDPYDELARRILAASRYVRGDERAALGAWNALGEPRLSGVRVYGLRRTAYRTLREQLGLAGGALLTPGRLAAVRRRVAAVPAFSRTRVRLRAPRGGRAELEVAVSEGDVLPSSLRAAGAVAIRAVASEELAVDAMSPAGRGERWASRWSWRRGRPLVELSLAAPGGFGVPGVWTVLGSWERESYGPRDPGAGAAAAGGGSAAAVEREERRRARLGWARWTSGLLRLEASAGLDEWTRSGAPGTRLALSGAAELRGHDDREALRLEGTLWSGSGRDFASAAIAVAARSRPRAPVVVSAGGGLAWVGPGTPRTEWPGAGTGKARTALLRAHPLHEEGVIRGEAFGRALAHVSAELTFALPRLGPLRPRLALFADVARPWETGGIGVPELQVDVGPGLAAGLPTAGDLRLDYGRGLRDGQDAITVRWQAPWPAW